jgi:chromosome segregation ATPase
MTLDQIDHLLAEWRARLDFAAQNLVDLRSHPTYLQLTARQDLTGVTLARVEPMLASMVNLFDYFDRLQASMAQAEEVRKTVPKVFVSADKINEIARILTAPAMGELLTKLTQELDAAKQVVLGVDSALRLLNSQLDTVQRDGKGLEDRIAAARQLIATDPLAAQQETDALTQLLARKADLKKEIGNAQQALNNIEVAHKQAANSYQEASLKIQSSALREPCPPQTISALAQWLKTLTAKLDEGAWDAVAIGIENWRQSAARCLQLEMEAVEANQKPVLLRRELRGRLDALKAKAVAKGKSEDTQLATLGKQARDMLQANRTSIEQAEQMVRDFEKRLTLLLCQ